MKVKWFHNAQPLTSICEFLSSDLAQKYDCKMFSPQQHNISLELTVESNCWFKTLVTRSDQCFEKKVAVKVHGCSLDRNFNYLYHIMFSSLYITLQNMNSLTYIVSKKGLPFLLKFSYVAPTRLNSLLYYQIKLVMDRQNHAVNYNCCM